jgi:adenylate kinase
LLYVKGGRDLTQVAEEFRATINSERISLEKQLDPDLVKHKDKLIENSTVNQNEYITREAAERGISKFMYLFDVLKQVQFTSQCNIT